VVDLRFEMYALDAIGGHPTWQIGQYHRFKEKNRGLILPGICVLSVEMPASKRG
jgi:hypothetical protein